MKIILNETEIHEALIQYVSDNQNIDLSTRSISVELIAGRSPKGHSAEINVLPAGVVAESTAGEATEGLEDLEDPGLKTKQAISFDFSELDN